jgi:hypothetical protein
VVYGSLFTLLGLALALKGFRLLLHFSPYYPFPYGDASRAIGIIESALSSNKGSRVLRRRLGLYYLAGGRFRDAEHVFHGFADRPGNNQPYRLLEGVSLLGSGQEDRGAMLIRESFGALSSRQKEAVRRELPRILRSPGLKARVLNHFTGRFV